MTREKLKNPLPDDFAKAMYEDIHQNLTPDFSGEDWMQLHNNAYSGDIHSAEMFLSLWKQRVEPYYSDDFKNFIQIQRNKEKLNALVEDKEDE